MNYAIRYGKNRGLPKKHSLVLLLSNCMHKCKALKDFTNQSGLIITELIIFEFYYILKCNTYFTLTVGFVRLLFNIHLHDIMPVFQKY